MKNVTTLEEAIKRIEELENENAKLREELEYYKNRKLEHIAYVSCMSI